MSITAVVTNKDYARYLTQCLETAQMFCDEILIYDDGSTDESLEVIRSLGLTCVHRDVATGSPVWGSNLGIEQASCDRLIFLDSDNFLIAPPPIRDTDYTFADIYITDDEGRRSYWHYATWPLTAEKCMAKFRIDLQIPFPWGGVWRTEWLKGREWREWPSTQGAADFRTALDWCAENPTLAYSPEPFLAFRQHAGQCTASNERGKWEKDARAFAATF